MPLHCLEVLEKLHPVRSQDPMGPFVPLYQGNAQRLFRKLKRSREMLENVSFVENEWHEPCIEPFTFTI